MRNVVPGFQVSKLADPKIGPAINSGYASLHGATMGGVSRGLYVRHFPPAQKAPFAARPGRNPGIAPDGYKVK